MKDNQKHLTLSERIVIEQGLNKNKELSIILKAVRRNRTLKQHKASNKNGARLGKIFGLIGISIRTYQRWLKCEEDKRKTTIRPTPKNKLTFQEEQEILKIINSINYRNLPPTQIVPRLADKGIYLASESTMYRVMKRYNQNTHRGKAKQAVKRPISSHVAYKPNKVWTWDITWLTSHIRGKYYKLYLIVDIYSRMIVAW